MPKEFKPLDPQMKAMIDAAAATEPADLVIAMRLALMFADYEICTYITAKHFDKLPAIVQAELRASGLKTISDMAQDLADGLHDEPAVPNAPASNSVH